MEELRQLMECKLLEPDQEPRNVQVVIHEVKSTAETRLHLSLIDETGVLQNTEVFVHLVTVAELAEMIDGLEETKLRLGIALQTVQWQQQQGESGQQNEIGRLRSELEAERKNEHTASSRERSRRGIFDTVTWKMEGRRSSTALECLPRDSFKFTIRVSAGEGKKRKGKAPRVDWFTGENIKVRVDD